LIDENVEKAKIEERKTKIVHVQYPVEVIIERPILIQVPVEVFIDRVVYKEVPVVVEKIVEV
jgi:hypothetical protein